MRSLLIVCLLCALVGCRDGIFKPCLERDPALMAEDPSTFLGDDWDRRAATIVDGARGTRLLALVGRPGTEAEIVAILRTTKAPEGASEAMPRTFTSHASEVLLIRRGRAAYGAAAEAMGSEDAMERAWGLGTLEFVESRRGVRDSPEAPGPPYEGPERDAAITAAARILIDDPDPDLRHRAVLLMENTFAAHDEPSVEAIAVALAQESVGDHRMHLLWLLKTRKAPAPLILDAAQTGYRDPVEVSVGIYDLFVEENRALLETAFAKGDTVFRAGVGETFYRHQSPMPWARDLVLKGLADPEFAVRVRFGKGALVLKPFDAEVRARLEALSGESYPARWALAINDGREPEPPPDDVHVRSAPPAESPRK